MDCSWFCRFPNATIPEFDVSWIIWLFRLVIVVQTAFLIRSTIESALQMALPFNGSGCGVRVLPDDVSSRAHGAQFEFVTGTRSSDSFVSPRRRFSRVQRYCVVEFVNFSSLEALLESIDSFGFFRLYVLPNYRILCGYFCFFFSSSFHARVQFVHQVRYLTIFSRLPNSVIKKYTKKRS